MENKIDFVTDLDNYYGTVGFADRNGEYIMVLDDWDCEQSISISKEFYEAAKKEFGE